MNVFIDPENPSSPAPYTMKRSEGLADRVHLPDSAPMNVSSRTPEIEMAVVILSVGAPPELTGAIESILHLKTEVEIVVVNSGGGDVQARLPKEFAGIKVLSFPHLLGPGPARNEGINATSAPYVAFLAADCRAVEGWVEIRLKHHRSGVPVVASSVVNSHPRNLSAWASHIVLFGRRLPGAPTAIADRYGASYDRNLFVRHGLFEDIRVGEDTEFHLRIRHDTVPAWVPEVRTVHLNPRSPRVALGDHSRRGFRSGKFWPQNHKGGTWQRVIRKFRRNVEVTGSSISGLDRLFAFASLPMMLLCNIAHELGANNGKRESDPLATLEGKARAAAKAKFWQKALKLWARADELSPGRPVALLGKASALAKTGLLSEAEAIYQKLRRDWPDLMAGHEGAATVVSQRGRWDEALEAWTAAARLAPASFAVAKGLASALQELGREDEAHAAFADIKQRFPDNPAGSRGLARNAMLRQDWDQALEIYQELWDLFQDPDAIKLKINLLVNLHRIPEADELVVMLEASQSSPLARLHAALPVLEARHQWDEIIRLLEENRPIVRGQLELMGRYVSALALLGRAEEALPVVRRSKAGSVTDRKFLLILVLIRANRHADADDKLIKLRRGKHLPKLPPMFLSMLVSAVIEHEGKDAAEEMLALIGKQALCGKRGSQLHLGSLFHREKLLALRSSTGSAPRLQAPDVPLESAVERFWDEFVPDAAKARDSHVTEAIRVFRGWREHHPAFFPDPSFVLSDAIKVATRIVQALDESQPLSLLRLGDGEGNILPYRDSLKGFADVDRKGTQRTWWGGTLLTGEAGEAVGAEFQGAIRAADVVGIPDLYRVCLSSGRDKATALGPYGKNIRGLLATLDFTAGLPLFPDETAPEPRLLTSCHIHQSLAYWGLWDVLLPRFGEVSLVTCHQELAEKLNADYRVEIGDVHLIPSERRYADAFQSKARRSHYPEVFHELRGRLREGGNGRVHLVAAGMLGKIYCKWIKEAGGIALDVGSAADYWCGYQTRGLDEISCYRQPPGMRRHLESLAASVPAVAKLFQTPRRIAKVADRGKPMVLKLALVFCSLDEYMESYLSAILC